MGELWGISADSWAEGWATFIGSLLAAGVAIWILWRQSRNQDAQAREDRDAQAAEAKNQRDFQASEFAKTREHDLELARLNREVDSLIDLWKSFTAYVEAQEMLYRTWAKHRASEADNQVLRETKRVISRYRIFEVTLYKWGVSCGLNAEHAREIAVLFNVAASHVITHAGDNLHGGMQIHPEINQAAHAFAEKMLISGSLSPSAKKQFLDAHVNTLRKEITSIIDALDAIDSKPIHESALVQ